MQRRVARANPATHPPANPPFPPPAPDAECGAAAAAPMREAALREGALLRHLHLALFSPDPSRVQLSRELVASWADEFSPALALLRRIFPSGLVRWVGVGGGGEAGVHAYG